MSQNGSNESTAKFYDLTHFLSGHGGYRAYFYRFGRDDSPYCPICEMIPEDVKRAVFNYPRFAAHRADVEIDPVARLLSDNNVDYMVASETTWSVIEKLIKAIDNLLRKDEFLKETSK